METIASIVSILSLVSLSLACSPEGWHPRTNIQRVHDSSIVLYGKILRHFPDDTFTQPIESAYKAEMQVYCVIKGPQDLAARPVVNISEAGFVPGMCHATDLQVDKSYILTLRDSGDRPRLIPDEVQMNADKLEEVAKACGLSPFTPQGSAMDMCPTPASPSACVPSTPREPSGPHMPSPPPPPKDGAEQMPEKEPENTVEGSDRYPDAGAVHGMASASSASFSFTVVMTTIYLTATALLWH